MQTNSGLLYNPELTFKSVSKLMKLELTLKSVSKMKLTLKSVSKLKLTSTHFLN